MTLFLDRDCDRECEFDCDGGLECECPRDGEVDDLLSYLAEEVRVGAGDVTEDYETLMEMQRHFVDDDFTKPRPTPVPSAEDLYELALHLPKLMRVMENVLDGLMLLASEFIDREHLRRLSLCVSTALSYGTSLAACCRVVPLAAMPPVHRVRMWRLWVFEAAAVDVIGLNLTLRPGCTVERLTASLNRFIAFTVFLLRRPVADPEKESVLDAHLTSLHRFLEDDARR